MAAKNISLTVLMALLVLVPSGVGAVEDATVERVLDGGSLILANGDIVKYAGIVIPTTEPQNFKRAAGFNRSLVEGADVKLEFDIKRRDEDGNLLAYVYVDEVFVNLELVRLGYAEVDTTSVNTRYRKLFFRLQKDAFEMGRGLWAERFNIPRRAESGKELIEFGEVAPMEEAPERGVPLKGRDRPSRPIGLELRLLIGDALTYSVDFSQSFSTDGGGNGREVKQSGEMTLTYVVEDIRGGEVMDLAATIESIGSYTTDEAVLSEEMATLQGIVGRGVKIRMSGRGELLEVSNLDEQILALVPQPHLQSLLLGIFRTRFPLADHPVGVGTFWFDRAEIPLKHGDLAVTLLGQVKYIATDFVELDGRPCVRIDMVGDLSGDSGGVSEMGGMAVEGKAEGSIYLDFQEGLPVMVRTAHRVDVVTTDPGTEEEREGLTLKREITLRLKGVARGENYVSPELAAGRPPFRMYVRGPLVNVREGSGTDTAVVNRVKRGQGVDVLARKGRWYKVELEKRVEGWIRGDLLSGEVPAEIIPVAEEAMEAEAAPTAAEGEGAEVSAAEGPEMPVPEGMVLIPAGGFIMGSDEGEPNSAPAREVEVEAFYLDEYEVTNAQYKGFAPEHVFPQGKESHPVVDVTWEEADRYCRSLGKRLPTEEEWEKAARGIRGDRFPWGDEFSPDRANTIESGVKDTMPVGSYPEGVSSYGAYDMAGNAAEWTASYYQPYPGNQAEDPDYGESFRVLRGGSWFNTQLQAAGYARMHDSPNSRRSFYGFRCAVSPSEAAEEAAPPAELGAEEVAQEVKPPAAEEVKVVEPVEEEPEGFLQYTIYKAKRSVGSAIDKLKGLIGR